MQAGPVPLTKQTALVALVVLVTLTGAGVGLLGNVDEPNQTAPSTTATPTPPTVETTPPTTAEPPATTTKTPSESVTESATESATESTETASRIEAALSLSVTDPDDVANSEGHVAGLRGHVSGTLSWTGDVDSVVLVVSSWSPHDGWVEKRRTALTPTGQSLALADALNRTHLLYVRGECAAAFDNHEDATEVTRRGYVGVTAVFFDDGRAVGRVGRTAAYRFDVRNVGTVDVTLSGVDSGQTAMTVSNVSPAASGQKALTVQNNGTANGMLHLYIRDVGGAENGFAEPETEGDGPGSELLDAFGLRIAAVGGGERTYLLGTADSYATLGSYTNVRMSSLRIPSGETRRIVVEWHVPPRLSSAAMTDSVSFDIQFQLVSY